MVTKEKLIQLRLSLVLIFFFISCASIITRTGHYRDIYSAFEGRNYRKAAEAVIKAREEGSYEKKDRVLFYLDMGIILHNAGHYKKSNEALGRAEMAIEENFTKSISRLAKSMILNDNVLDYAGEDYEDVFTNILMALNYIHLDSLDDAMVEVRRINMKLSRLESKYGDVAQKLSQSSENANFKAGETDLSSSTTGSFLSMISYLNMDQYDEAEIDRKRIIENIDADIPLLDSLYPVDEKENLPLYVICFTGMGPVKKPIELSLDLDPGLNIGIITLPGEESKNMIFEYHGEEEMNFKFAVPEIKRRDTRIDYVKLVVDGVSRGKMHLLEDLNKIAIKTFQVRKPILYLRAGLRTFLKAMAGSKVKEGIDEEKGGDVILGSVLKFAVDQTLNITENADLRCWRTMPGYVYVKRIFLEPGPHEVEFQYLDDEGRIVDIEKKGEVRVREESLNLTEGVSYR